MTEYATTPSAIEEWKNQRNRTSDWVKQFAVGGLPPTPTDESDFDKRSLWDGGGWEPPSDCESSTSVPPTMMLQYADARQVYITPTTSHVSASNTGSHGGSRHGTRRTGTHVPSERRDEERTERARSIHPTEPLAPASVHNASAVSSAAAPKSTHETGVAPSQTSSMRFARAAAAPLPDSHSSSSGAGSAGFQSASKRSVRSSVAPGPGPAAGMPRSMRHERSPSPSPSPLPSQQPSYHPSRLPSQVPSHHPSHTPTYQPVHVSTHQPSHVPSQRPSHAPTHQPSYVPSHQPSHVPSQHPLQAPSLHPPQAPSLHPSHVPSHHQQVSHPPSAFSNHTAASPPGSGAPAAASPPSIHSINSRSISLADSRSSGPPEPIVIHPPSNPSRSAGPSPTHTQPPNAGAIPGHGGAYTPTAHLPYVPPSAGSGSLSYYSAPRQSHAYDQATQRQSITPSHHTTHVHQNGQLPTPVSPGSHAHFANGDLPMRAPSSVATGLGGGFVMVDAPSPGYEKELERELNDRKGSGKSNSSQKRERGSLFNVFGGRPGGHSRSRSLPMAGLDEVRAETEDAHEAPVQAPHQSRYSHSQQNPYLTPISPMSPISPVDPTRGPHPPSIVYAPARHHRATHYAPPRIMYMPASPRGQRHAPYDTQQLLQPHAHGYPQGAMQGYPQYVVGSANGYAPPAHGVEHVPGSVRRSRTSVEPVRDSGWDEGKGEGLVVRQERGASAGDYVARDFAYGHANEQPPTSPHAPASHASADPPAPAPAAAAAAAIASPTGTHTTVLSDPVNAPSVKSDATSQRTNMAGVGTISARSRSRGRQQHEGENENEVHTVEGQGERSRSRARGMVYSTSAPQPHGSAPPHAAMMVPPSTARERGVRDTPYPTPPGSTSEHQQSHLHPTPHQGYTPVMGLVPNGYGAHHATQAPVLPAAGVESSPGPGGLISRFHNIYHRTHNAAVHAAVHPAEEDKENVSSSPTRGRARERRKKEPRTKLRGIGNGHVHEHGHTRSHSVNSDASCSSVSTYYVIPTPGQKVRIIRTDGQTVTTTTSGSRNISAGGWLKKAATLRPRFLHRDRDNSASPVKEKDSGAHESHRNHDTPIAPVAERTPSGGSDKSKKKGSRKLVRRNSTGAPVLLSNAQQEQEEKVAVGAGHDHGRSRDVDIVFPGQ